MTEPTETKATLARKGVPATDVHETMRDIARGDLQWKQGMAAGTAYPAGDDVLQVAKDAYEAFFSVNALYPTTFPSVARFESEVVEMTAGMLHGDEAVGAISSGGTESILLAVKSARDRARAERPEVTEPEMVVAESAHPAFWKAAHGSRSPGQRRPSQPSPGQSCPVPVCRWRSAAPLTIR